jgi:hypothetical protein
VNETSENGATGTPLGLLLADDFFFAAHDDITGKSRLSERAGGLGLAAALLGELVLFRKIIILNGEAIVVDRRPLRDAVANIVLGELLREPAACAVRDWLRFLGRNACGLVAQRMERAGLVRIAETRRLRKSIAYPPIDMNTSAWPTVRLAQKLTRRESLSLPDTVLAGLMSATGLDGYLRSEADAEIHHYLEYLVAHLPPPLRALVAETEAAIGDAVLHHRM